MGPARAGGRHPGLRRPADHRDGALQARRAPPQGGRRQRRQGRRPLRARALRGRARAHDALDPRRGRRDPHHAGGHGPRHRRLQVRPDAGRRHPRRRRAPGRARPGGPAAAVRRLHQRRPSRLLAQRGDRRAQAPGDLPGLRGAHRGHLLRVEHPSRPAGRPRGGRPRAQGLARRALDAQERQHRALAGPHRRARGDPRAAARARGLARREARDHLDRVPGRAAQRAAAHGPPRPPAGRAAPGRHRALQRHPDPGQRARRQRDDRPPLPHRLRRDHDPRGADPRVRARLSGGAQADAQPDPAALRDALPRRPQAHPPARAPGRGGRHRRRQRLQGRERPAAGARRQERALRASPSARG